jgi:hypothetical protein
LAEKFKNSKTSFRNLAIGFYRNNGNNSTDYSVVKLFSQFSHFGEISHKTNRGLG